MPPWATRPPTRFYPAVGPGTFSWPAISPARPTSISITGCIGCSTSPRVSGGSEDGFVLIRALEPVRGLDRMLERRFPGKPPAGVPIHALCSGPGKLTIAMGIDGGDHGQDLCRHRTMGFRRSGPAQAANWVSDLRVGITKSADFPWRFLVPENRFVSAKLGALTENREKHGGE